MIERVLFLDCPDAAGLTHQQIYQREAIESDTLLISGGPGHSHVVGIPSKKCGAVLSSFTKSSKCPPSTSLKEIQQVFHAHSQEVLPRFEMDDVQERETLPGGFPLLDHVFRVLIDHQDWYKLLERRLRALHGHRLPNFERISQWEVVLGESDEEELSNALQVIADVIQEDKRNMIHLQAGDVEDFQVDLDWGVTKDGFNALLSRISGAKKGGKKELVLKGCRLKRPAANLPVRFFFGGYGWQFHILLPVVHSVVAGQQQLTLKLDAPVTDGMRRLFKALPHMVGCGIYNDFLPFSKTLFAIFGEDLFAPVPRPIELRDLMHLAGCNTTLSSMFSLNWWVMGSLLPKHLGSRGDNRWGTRTKDMPDSLVDYLVADTHQPVVIAWVLVLIWTYNKFPDMLWVSEVSGGGPGDLLEWVSTHVVKDRLSNWRTVYMHENGHWGNFKIIPNLTPEVVASVGNLSTLLSVIGIPTGNKWDILRVAPKWPSVTAGGPQFIHSVRAFCNGLLPILRQIDPEFWRLLEPDQLVFTQFGEVVDPSSYPQDAPESKGSWRGNPGVVNPIPDDFNQMTRDMFKRRKARVSIMEYQRLSDNGGRDLVLFFESHPSFFRELVGHRRHRQVMIEMRDAVHQLGEPIARLPEWKDPFAVHLHVAAVKRKFETHAQRVLDQAVASQERNEALLARTRAALEQSRQQDPGDQSAVFRASLPRRILERDDIREIRGAQRAFGRTEARNPGTVPSQAEHSGAESQVEGPPARKQRTMPPAASGQLPAEFELWLQDSELEEFGGS